MSIHCLDGVDSVVDFEIARITTPYMTKDFYKALVDGKFIIINEVDHKVVLQLQEGVVSEVGVNGIDCSIMPKLLKTMAERNNLDTPDQRFLDMIAHLEAIITIQESF